MRQKLLALAIMSAASVTATSAIAQSANPVTLYGTMRIAVESVKASGGTTNMPSRIRVEDQNTLFGIRGTETISPELTAFFQIESSVILDAGGGTIGSRNSAVGLRGNWGSLSLGRWDTPVKAAVNNLSPYSDVQLSGIQSIMNDAGSYNLRPNNSIIYVSPTFGGVTARLHYAANEAKTSAVNPALYSFSAIYDKDGYQLGYAYEQHKDRTGSETVVLPNYKESNNTLLGKVTFGPVWLSAIYQEFSKTNATKQKAAYIGANYTLGDNQFKFTYSESKDGGATTATLQPKSTGVSLGWYYSLSKRTTLTTVYSDIKNNEATNRAGFAKTPLTRCSSTVTSNCVSNDGDSSGFSVGFQHTF